MRLGPLDRRLERSRCLRCAKSHLKCSGGTPCTGCSKRNQKCVYPAKTTTIAKFQLVNRHTIQNSALARSKIPQKPSLEHSNNVLNIFLTRFVGENSFTGCSSTWFADIQTYFASDKAVHHALKALSQLYAYRESNSDQTRNKRLALESYQTAVLSVRQVVDAEHAKIPQSLVSSTFLLGLFELMYDPTGEGWIKHTMFGTSRILQHLGPEAFRSGLGLSFFNQMRMFEVSRSLLFSESSFLVQSPWMNLMDTDINTVNDVHPMNDLLNLMIKCSDHCARALSYLEGVDKSSLSLHEVQHLRGLAVEGFDLRLSLCEMDTRLSTLNKQVAKDNRTTIAKIYLAATSIFLSGVYDYRSIWLETIEATPALSHVFVEQHVNTMLDLTEYAMQETNLSKLLFLYPLRVACSRVWTCEPKDRLRSLFGTIRKSFAVAHVFVAEIEELWETPMSDRSD
ncbi:hypothetical protein M436DRAFT_75823 [Aureobasidium namibiae CBS 147.97]|uniref:Zn(2)-C6 fungal-type domain-containing protein n=1 Tax=Aureobasidium namibiae CBS 147.97 TaxID=1043004 RepID=A0A074W9W6_9PEZI